MKYLRLFFCNFWVIIPVSLIYALACAVATFIENDYGTLFANSVVYRAFWFNLLHVYLGLCLFFTFVFSSAWTQKKYSVLIFHLAFFVIILGSGITRFLSFEGLMHIREGDEKYSITASEPTINIMAVNGAQDREFYFLHKMLLSDKSIEQIRFFGKILELKDFKVKRIGTSKQDDTLEVSFDACYDLLCNPYHLTGNSGGELSFKMAAFGDTKIFISYGSREIPLPFGLRLNKFELERYPGSMSPSSYTSMVDILDKSGKLIRSYDIFMNNVLDFDGFRFYQSSYDEDEKGTILSVNRDPGKNITYLGYFLLIVGGIWILFSKNGRFLTLSRFLRDQRAASFVLILFLGVSPHVLKAQENQDDSSFSHFSTQKDLTDIQKADFLNIFSEKSKSHIKEFSKIQIQNFLGRVEPIQTLAYQVVHKVTNRTSLFGMNEEQIFLGMILYPQVFKDLKLISISGDERIAKILGVKDRHYASLSDFFDSAIGYKLNNYVQESNRRDPSKRDTFDKNILKVDERVNLVYSVFVGSFLRIFPVKGSNTWLDPSAIREGSSKATQDISHMLSNLFIGFDNGLFEDDWNSFESAIRAINSYQKENGSDLYLTQPRVSAEIFLNSSDIFSQLTLPYLVLGLLFLALAIYSMVRNNSVNKKLKLFLFILACICLSIQTLSLILRWYISQHSPWSNAYESMLYIAWAASFGGIIFFWRYPVAISASLFLAGVCLFVAHLGFMDPQITPLVPVLKSYWLNIHVSIITASYGFLGLCFILGIITLILFAFRSKRFLYIDNSIRSIYALNEMAMILGIIFLSIGNFLGGVWANESWGRYWSWDPKETWALISIVVYSVILHLRFMGFLYMPYIFSMAATLGFYVILMTYFGVNYYLSGMHSYAAGDPIPIPVFLYYFIGFNLLLIVLAFFKRKLKM